MVLSFVDAGVALVSADNIGRQFLLEDREFDYDNRSQNHPYQKFARTRGVTQ